MVAESNQLRIVASRGVPGNLAEHTRVSLDDSVSGRVFASGKAIPLEARILAVVDAYDAMTSLRPYRDPMPHEAAAEELRRGAGVQFDARCVEAFLGLQGDVLDASARNLAAGDQ
jgi:hypothetical protein